MTRKTVCLVAEIGPRGLLSSLLSALLFLPTVLGNAAVTKNGISPNSISLPTGPGSIEGLGEDFQPHLNTGTASYQIPFKVPSGPTGSAPELSLTYEGGNGNGWVGYGWSLNMPSIRRQCEKGLPQYDLTDRFLDPKGEELIYLPDRGYYFPENQEQFIRWENVGEHWRGHAPDGTISEFGLTADARIASGTRVYRWLLEKETDRNGNVVQYLYQAFAGEDNLNQKYLHEIRYGPGTPPWSASYIIACSYEDRSDDFEDYRLGFVVRTGKRLARIDIALQGSLPPGHLVGDVNADGTQDALIRRYVLGYDADHHWSFLSSLQIVGADGDPDKALPPAVFKYPIHPVPEVISAATAAMGCLSPPPSVIDSPYVKLIDLNADGLPDMLNTPVAGNHRAIINLGVEQSDFGLFIRWSEPQDVGITNNDERPFGYDLESEDVSLIDMDGDGLADLTATPTSDMPFYFRNNGDISWGPRIDLAIAPDDVPPPAPFGNNDVLTTDLDFDKRIDIVRSVWASGYEVWYNRGDAYIGPVTAEGAIDSGEAVQFTLSPGGDRNNRVQLVDLNGDRLTDVARIQANSISFFAGMGRGSFEEKREIPIPTDNGIGGDLGFGGLSGAETDRASLSDVTGDGLADLVLMNPEAGFHEIWFWINLGYRTFSRRHRITDLPDTFSDSNKVEWADINGNGTKDLIYADSNLEPEEKMRSLDVGNLISGCDCPNLLKSIENGIGRKIELEYRYTTYFAIQDRLTRPWTRPVPNPVAVVSKITTHDGLGHSYVTEINYHDGYYDGVEKEFRGFASADRIDVGDESQPTLVSEYAFDVGDVTESFKGKTLGMVTKNTEGAVFTEEEDEWETRSLHTIEPTPIDPMAPKGVSFPFLARRIQIIREEPSGPPIPASVTLESEYDYDNYGNQIKDANFGQVQNGDHNYGADERITWMRFSANPNSAIWNLPIEQVVTDNSSPPRVVAHSLSYFDGPTFEGLPLGNVTQGNLSRSSDWAGPHNPPNPPDPLPDPPARTLTVAQDPTDYTFSFDANNEDDHWIEKIRNRYDTYGNILTIADPLAVVDNSTPSQEIGHFRNLGYDPSLHTFPQEEHIFTGNGNSLVMTVEYDLAHGTIIRSTDFNGHETQYQYDQFGRITTIAKPGGSPSDSLSMPTLEFEYILASPVPLQAGNGMINWIETRQHETFGDPDAYFITRTFVDGLGREVLSKQEDERPSRVVVSGAKSFNARRMEFEAFQPFYSMNGFGFENLENPAFTGTWVIGGASQTLGAQSAPRTRKQYDATGRLTQTIQPDGFFSETRYQPLISYVFDEEDTRDGSPHQDTPMVYYKDGLDRFIGVDEVVKLNDDGTPAAHPVAWHTSYEYDLLDNLIQITDSQNNRKSVKYDAIKRKVYMDDPDRGRMWYTYDDASNLIESVDAKQQRITYTHDGANRLLTEDYHDDGLLFPANRVYDPLHTIGDINQPDVSYHYDAPAPGGPIDLGDTTSGTGENLKGFLSYVVDLSGQEHNSYDERGNVKWVVKRIPDPPTGIPVSYKTEFTYDASSRVVDLIYADNDRISYTYNSRLLPESIPGILHHIDYAPSSQLAKVLCSNGVCSTYRYDNRLRLAVLSHISTNQSDLSLVDYSYDFDAASNIVAIHDKRPLSVVPADSPRRNTQLFQYDSLYRLTQVKYPRSNQIPQIDYRYDRIGNMLFQSSPAGPGHIEHNENGISVVNHGSMAYGGSGGKSDRTGRVPGSPPGPHALTSTDSGRSYGYDDNGNMTDIEGATTEWDFKDRLLRYRKKGIDARYTYDYSGRRISKMVEDRTGTTHVLYPDRSFEIREFNAPKKYVWNGETRVAQVTNHIDTSRSIVTRLRLMSGWNLVTVSVQMPNMHLAEIFGTGAEVYRRLNGEYVLLAADDLIFAGSPYWIRVTSPDVRVLRGTPVELPALDIPPGRHLLAWTGPAVLSLGSNLTNHYTAWAYDPDKQKWQLQTTWPDYTSLNNLPPRFGPGTAFWVDHTTLSHVLADFSGYTFLHQDHLSSTIVIATEDDNKWNDLYYYPFGYNRLGGEENDGSTRSPSTYAFCQKEADNESLLSYFGHRYYISLCSQFISCDPEYTLCDVSGRRLESAVSNLTRLPQRLNNYGYALKRPLTVVDLDGRVDIEILRATSKTPDPPVVVGVPDVSSLNFNPNEPLSQSPLVNFVGTVDLLNTNVPLVANGIGSFLERKEIDKQAAQYRYNMPPGTLDQVEFLVSQDGTISKASPYVSEAQKLISEDSKIVRMLIYKPDPALSDEENMELEQYLRSMHWEDREKPRYRVDESSLEKAGLTPSHDLGLWAD